MADERNDDRIPPIGLPAGSFELSELQSALDAAVSVKDREKHPERINKAIADTIKQPDTLANMDAPGVPLGASMVEDEIVYGEGQEPVKRKTIAFDSVEAENGQEASKMHYEQRGRKTVASDEPAGAPPPPDGDAPATLSEQAAERAEEMEDTSSSKAGARSK